MDPHPSTLAESLAALRTAAQRTAASARPALEALLLAIVLRLLRGLEREALAWSARTGRAAAPLGRFPLSARATARRESVRRRQARLRRARLRRRRRIIARLGYILRCLPGLGMTPSTPAPPPRAPTPPARPPPCPRAPIRPFSPASRGCPATP